MPELPEVETVVRGLEAQIIGQSIEQMTCSYERMLQTPKDIFTESVVGQSIVAIERFGKYILIVLSNQKVIRVHLRMEGKFFITTEEKDATLDKHVHLVLKLGRTRYLKYHDVRKFGTFELIERVDDWHDDAKFGRLGYEPWEYPFTVEFLYEQLQRSRQMIKPFLLDQKTIVGLGNIYVDEVLFRSNIHPETRTREVTKEEAAKIKDAAISILQKAIELGGSTIRTYHNTFGIDGMFQTELQVHLRAEQPCLVCHTVIEKQKVGGRGTYVCPTCQILKK